MTDDKFAALHYAAMALHQCRGLNHIKIFPKQRIGKDEYVMAVESDKFTHIEVENENVKIYVPVEANAPFYIVKALVDAVDRRFM